MNDLFFRKSSLNVVKMKIEELIIRSSINKRERLYYVKTNRTDHKYFTTPYSY
jgi:hypothetical protein